MGRAVAATRTWDAVYTGPRDPYLDRDFELVDPPVRFRVCSRTDGVLRCLQAPATQAMLPETLLAASLVAGTVRRVD